MRLLPETKKQFAGSILVSLSILCCIFGYIGWSTGGEVSDIQTPTIRDYSFFSNEPIPSELSNMLITSQLKLTWDSEEIYVVIVDEDEKNSCPVEAAFMEGATPGGSCSSTDQDILAGGAAFGPDKGITWVVEQGPHYVGLGSRVDTLSSNADVTIGYEVHIRASFALYFIIFLVGIGGVVMWWD
jgi:hypothetical protein